MSFRSKFGLVLVAFFALAVFVGCSDDDDPVIPPAPDPTVTETIGATGGTLTMANKMELQVPAGALTADVVFVAGPNETPPVLPAGLMAVSAFFSIEPSGTDFGQDATLTLFYAEDDLPTFMPEDALALFTFDGTDWTNLGGDIDELNNTVTADVGHLSDFVVTSPVPEDPDPVYLNFELGRFYSGDPNGAEFEGYDYLEAAFGAFAPDKTPPGSLEAGDVSYGAWDLASGMGSYYYSNDELPMFLTLGSTYDLVVEGNLEVTPLTLPITVMDEAVLINNLTDDMELDLAGFSVTWDGTALGGTVYIRLSPDGGSSVSQTLDNLGSYTFTESSLAALNPGPGMITVSWYREVPVTADGYLEDSHIEMQTSHEIPVVFTGGSVVLQDHLETSTTNLAIPDAANGSPGTPVTNVINMPITGAVDSVRVYLDISHTWMSDLIVKLTSPDGTQLRVLFIGEGGENDGRMQGWYPDDFTPKDDLNGFDGEAAGGNWTLTAQDYSQDAAGVLNSWRLQVFYTQ
ncbi:MAG: proprotein convertase P-domain-containing protein [Candidatus Krumholzibacteria bacterium]|nr:proprotein convertase P-domain-containing protein [Candidatus Krumholzibacteria bacterium]